MNEQATERDLLFAWEPARTRRSAILGFIFASAAGHALCFYLFQIVYPPTIALLPPPARVNIISGNTDEGRTLLRWIAAEDPALNTTTQRSPEAKAYALPKLNHVPSYLTIQPTLKPLPPSETDLRAPSSQPPGPVPMQRAQVPASAGISQTAVIFSRDLDSLGAVQKPSLKFTAATREPPQSAKFRVGVNNGGAVRYCFLQTSSGDTTLDQQAHAYLMQCRFAGSKDALPQLKWASAIFEWGNDISVPPATETLP